MSKLQQFISDMKTHWNTPDTAHGKYVSGREYLDIFVGVAANYAAMAPLKYIGFAASCFLIMHHYSLPYLSFAVISLIGVPLSYLWNLLDWFVTDNLGLLEKRSERVLNTIYLSAAAMGLLMLIFDASRLFPADGALITALDGISGINARSFFKIFGVQLLQNGWGGVRNILWRKKLVPKYGRYKFGLYENVIQKSVMVVLIGWLPIYEIPDVNERLWLANLARAEVSPLPNETTLEFRDRLRPFATVVGLLHTETADTIAYMPIAAGKQYSCLFPVFYMDIAEYVLLDYHSTGEFREFIKGVMDGSQDARFNMDTSNADRIYRIHRLIETLYPLTIAAALLLGGVLPGLTVLHASREISVLRALGAKIGKCTGIYTLAQVLCALAGLALGFVLVLCLQKPDPAAVLRPFGLYLAAHLAACALGSGAFAWLSARKHVLAQLQAKE